jgi:hypothetical protein
LPDTHIATVWPFGSDVRVAGLGTDHTDARPSLFSTSADILAKASATRWASFVVVVELDLGLDVDFDTEVEQLVRAATTATTTSTYVERRTAVGKFTL